VTVRPATVGDAPAIGSVHMRSWQETYGPLLPPGALDDLDPAQSGERWARTIEIGALRLWVATESETVVGYAASGAPTEEAAPRELQLWGLYLLASRHGSGDGQALLAAAVGDDPAYLWVAERNPRARAFYRRNGFVEDGARDVHELAGHPIDAVRMVR
jgi:ribosomal protein S18 acetylase RimI-like enzyme